MIWQLIDSSGVGGIERHVATLTTSLRAVRLPAEVVLYQDHGPNPWREQLESAGLTPRMLDGSPLGLLRAIAAARPGLIHTHGYKAGVLGRLAAMRMRIPAVSTFHSGERAAFPVNAYIQLDLLTSFLGKRIAVSENIRRRLPFPAPVIPSYVPAPDSPVIRPRANRIAFVGRLSLEKGPDVFCALADRAGAGASAPEEWHVYGDGPMRAALEAQYRGRIQFHGAVADMGGAWAGLGLLVMPSRFEGLPLAALEAMAAGVPILASNVGGLPQAVGHGETGWLFGAGDVNSALAGLRAWRALDGAAFTAMQEACWLRLTKRFSEDACVSAVLQVYESAGWRRPATVGAPFSPVERRYAAH
jgi:glycosyltransferase involved in cell wall biosynthesis